MHFDAILYSVGSTNGWMHKTLQGMFVVYGSRCQKSNIQMRCICPGVKYSQDLRQV
jgi:hypothetical protein